MIKILFMLILFAFSTECFSQEKQVEIYLGKASVEFASKNGVKPLTDKEREGYDYICENMTSPMLKILNVTVDDSRRMIVAVKKYQMQIIILFQNMYLIAPSTYMKGLNLAYALTATA